MQRFYRSLRDNRKQQSLEDYRVIKVTHRQALQSRLRLCHTTFAEVTSLLNDEIHSKKNLGY